jgi:hypothetical protein
VAGGGRVVYHAAVRLSAAGLLLAGLLLSACAAAPRAVRPAPVEPAEVLERFAGAAEDGRWEEAWALLSARWRARTTPGRLAADWRASGPVGPEAAARVLALLRSGARLAAGPREAVLAVAEGRRARLVSEEGGWRVDALE